MYEFHSRRTISAGALALSLLLAGCGGSDHQDCQWHCSYCQPCPAPYGAASGPTVAARVTGVVALGHPVGGAQVLGIDGTTGATCGMATTASDGSYTMSLQCTPGPVILTVTSGLPATMVLDAVVFPTTAVATSTGNTNSGVGSSSTTSPVTVSTSASSASSAGGTSPGATMTGTTTTDLPGTVNITPLTTLAVYGFVGLQTVLPGAAAAPDNAHVLAAMPLLTRAAEAKPGGVAALAAAYQGVVSTLVADLGPTLTGYGVSITGFDPVRTPFAANGTGIDTFFDAYPASLPSPSSIMLGTQAAPLIGITLPTSSNDVATWQGSAVTVPLSR